MSEKGIRAHEALARQFSNIPAWEDCSERTQSLLDKVGESFDQMDVLEEQFKKVEAQLDTDATAVEESLHEEIGDLIPRPRDLMQGGMQMMTLEQLNQLLGGPIPDSDDAEDDEPTIH